MADKTVTITLAHPLSEDRARLARVKQVKEYPVGAKVSLPPDEARALIKAGYAQGIDPDEPEQVADALGSNAGGKPKK